MNNRTPIQNELQIIAPGLAHLPAVMPYKVPQGYFETFAPHLLGTIQNEDFLLHILPKGKKMPYQVPAGYFENLAEDILGKVNMEQLVPEGYFDALPAILLNKVRHLEVSQELETVAPLLNTISKQPVQAVPEGYFEQLKSSAEQLILQRPPAIKKITGWLKYLISNWRSLIRQRLKNIYRRMNP